MSEKILSIAVCAYNMEQYLEQALDSCIIEDVDKLEVLIMNDGSTDRTPQIAEEFCNMYPDTFILVNKKNGGWGSNLNEGIKIANGKYFKEMDADDWFDTDNLQKLLNILSETDVDMVLTNHRYCYPDKIEKHTPEWSKYDGQTMKFSDADVFYFPIWDVAVKTEIIRNNYINLPEHTLYTDNLFVIYMLPYIKDISFNMIDIYNYRLGRDGQSVSVESIKKHYKDFVKVAMYSEKFYLKNKESENYNHIMEKLTSTYRIAISSMIRAYDKDEVNIKKSIMKLEKITKKRVPELYKVMWHVKKIAMLRVTNYKIINFVKKHGKF